MCYGAVWSRRSRSTFRTFVLPPLSGWRCTHLWNVSVVLWTTYVISHQAVVFILAAVLTWNLTFMIIKRKKNSMPVSPLVRELQISSCGHVPVHSGKQNCVIQGYIYFEYLLRDKIFKPRVNLRFVPCTLTAESCVPFRNACFSYQVLWKSANFFRSY
jgi:hypothetical protein